MTKFKMMREFVVSRWEEYNEKVEELRADIIELERRKRNLWDIVSLLDKLEKGESEHKP